MKKGLLLATLLAFCLCNFAQDNSCYLNVTEKGAGTAMLSVAFSESQTFTYDYDNETAASSLIAAADGQVVATLVLDKQYIISYTDHDIPTAVKELFSASKVNVKGGMAFVSNLKANDVVNVFAANGVQIASAVANANGVAQINISAMPKGIVIIKTGNASFKIKM